MDDIPFNIQNIQNLLEINYLSNLIKSCEKNGLNKKYLLEEKLLKLSENSEIKNTIPNNTESPTTSTQYTDDYLYLKPWVKLNTIHKIIKIKEYINMLLINDENEKNELKEKLINMIKTKIITKKDSILYDSTKGKIISIPNLQFINGKYVI
jgi:hypothetical protein